MFNKIVARVQKCNTSPILQDAVCLASSGIYVQNLIQYGNLLSIRAGHRAVSFQQTMRAASHSVSKPQSMYAKRINDGHNDGNKQ